MSSNYFLYVRKSTDSEERQILSIEAQLAELKLLAEKENLRIKSIFQEAMTAKVPGRPIFNDMIARIEKGEADGIIAWHPDRLARNSIDGGRIIYLLDTGHIKFLKFPTFWFENTPQGKFMMQIAFGQSKYYIDNLSENVRRGLRQKVRRGEWPGGFVPPGYFTDKNDRKTKIHPIQGPLVKMLFETYAAGDCTLQDLRKVSYQWGLVSRTGKPWVKAELQRTFKNTFYYGLMKYKGEYHQGIHEPLITKELFDQVQEAMVRKGKPNKYKKKYFPLLGLATCPKCGCSITATIKKGHNYYHCTKRRGPCPEKYVREELYAQQISQAIADVSLSPEEYDFMMGELGKVKTTADQTLTPQKLQLKTQLKEIGGKLDRLLDAHLEGAVEKSEYLDKKGALLKQKVDAEEALAKLETEGAHSRLELCGTFLKEALGAGGLAMSSDLEAKRDFAKKIGWNFHLESRRLQFEYENPWGLLLGGETNCSNLGGLTSSEGGRSSVSSIPAAGAAAGIFRKSPASGEMRPPCNAVRTHFEKHL